MAGSDLSALSTEELMRMRGAQSTPADLSGLSTDELMKMRAGPKPELTAGDLAKGVGLWAAKTLVPGAAGLQIMDAIGKGANKVGEVVNDTAAKALPAPVAAGLGTATNVGLNVIPMALGGGAAAAKVGAPAMNYGAEWLMHSALKPGVKYAKGGADDALVKTLLDEGINVSKGGVEKMQSLIQALNEEIKTAIGGSTATVDKGVVASRLGDTLKRFETQVNPVADTKAIEGAGTEFMQHPMINGDQIPVQLAQDLKQGTYRVLKGKYGEQGSASTEAQKALARGLKEEIATAVPEVAPLNARESALLEALTPLERRAAMSHNNNLAGMSLIAHNPLAGAVFALDRSSLGKSILARLLNYGSEAVPATAGAATGGTLGALLGNPRDRR